MLPTATGKAGRDDRIRLRVAVNTTLVFMNKPTPGTRLARLLFITLLSTLGVTAFAQQAGHPPVPPDARPSVEPGKPGELPGVTGKEIPEYQDLARQLGAEIDKLVRKGLRDAADEVQRRMEKAGQPVTPDNSVREQVEHLRQAAEHLAQAGLEGDAANVRKQADELARAALVGVSEPAGLQPLCKRVEDLERTVKELRQELRELRRLLEQKPL